MVRVQKEEATESMPFSISDVYEGLAEVEGITRCEDDVLILDSKGGVRCVALVKERSKEAAASCKMGQVPGDVAASPGSGRDGDGARRTQGA